MQIFPWLFMDTHVHTYKDSKSTPTGRSPCRGRCLRRTGRGLCHAMNLSDRELAFRGRSVFVKDSDHDSLRCYRRCLSLCMHTVMRQESQDHLACARACSHRPHTCTHTRAHTHMHTHTCTHTHAHTHARTLTGGTGGSFLSGAALACCCNVSETQGEIQRGQEARRGRKEMNRFNIIMICIEKYRCPHSGPFVRIRARAHTTQHTHNTYNTHTTLTTHTHTHLLRTHGMQRVQISKPPPCHPSSPTSPHPSKHSIAAPSATSVPSATPPCISTGSSWRWWPRCWRCVHTSHTHKHTHTPCVSRRRVVSSVGA